MNNNNILDYIRGLERRIDILEKYTFDWIDYVPEYSATTGTLTTITKNVARYKLINGIYLFELNLTITDKGTSDGALIVSHPLSGIVNIRGFGSEAGSTGKTLIVEGTTGGNMSIRFYDYSTILTNGYNPKVFAIAV